MLITSNRVRLRPLKRTDSDLLYRQFLSDENLLYYLDVHYCSDIETANDFVQKTLQEISDVNCPYYQFWVIESLEDASFVGCIWSSEVDEIKRLTELEFFILPKEQRKGYMTDALRTLINYYFYLTDVYRIEGVCNVENSMSEKVMLKAGMQFEGCLRGRALNLNEEGNPGDLKMFSIIKSDIKL